MAADEPRDFFQSIPFLKYLVENHGDLALRILSKWDSKGNTWLQWLLCEGCGEPSHNKLLELPPPG